MAIKQLIILIFFIELALIISVNANEVNGWFGEENSGGGIAIADINKNGIPDLVVLNIDHPEGGNIGYYRVGFDLKPNNDASQWSSPMKIGGLVEGNGIIDQGWFGESTAAADIAIADLNNNGMPDLIIFHIDNPEGQDTGYYRVGWDLKPNGEASYWDVHLSDPIKVPGWFGKETQGGGIAVADLNNNGKPDLIVFNIQHLPWKDENYGNYRIGWDLNSKGEAQWDPYLVNSNGVPKGVGSWFGSDNQGGDIAVTDLNQAKLYVNSVVRTIDCIDHNVNARLALEVMLIDFPKMNITS